MNSHNAQLLFDIRCVSKSLFRFKSDLSKDILLYIASNEGSCDLRFVLRHVSATTIALRQHIQTMEKSGFIELCIDDKSKRCKIIKLTEKGIELLKSYELEIQNALKKWIYTHNNEN